MEEREQPDSFVLIEQHHPLTVLSQQWMSRLGLSDLGIPMLSVPSPLFDNMTTPLKFLLHNLLSHKEKKKMLLL